MDGELAVGQTAMTSAEALLLADCERVIRSGLTKFVEVGNALLAVRDKRLYRLEYKSFEDYCRARWHFSKVRATQLIQAAETVGNLVTIVTIPLTESQARPMAQLAAEQQQAAWAEALERSNGKPTAAVVEDVVREFNYKRDNKSNRAGDAYVPQGYDACQTPGYAIDPLLPFILPAWKVWEPACGDGILVEALYDAGCSEKAVIGTDILTGQNFLEFEPVGWDCIITNPPYSIKYDWLMRCYELGKPFALLLPVETLGARSAQELMKQYGFEILLLDSRVDFQMPRKGWEGSAQFPVLWMCWHMLPAPVMFGSIEDGKRKFKHATN
jgi:hypothetical protein